MCTTDDSTVYSMLCSIQDRVVNPTFNNISAILWWSVNKGNNKITNSEQSYKGNVKTHKYINRQTTLPQVTNKLYHIMLDVYTSPSAGIELTTL